MSKLFKICSLCLLCLISPSIFAINNALLPQAEVGQPGKAPGDIIALSTRFEISAWCDFSKQIVFVQGVFVCSYNGSKVGQ